MATQSQTQSQPGIVAARGGSFLIEDRAPGEVFVPEEFSDEQRMIAQTAEQFMEEELVPRLPQTLNLEYEVTRDVMRKAGELGLLGVEIPEEYGGLGLDKISGCLVSEKASRDGSFAVTFMGHIGIGTLPIVYFGTEEQKQKYLPKLASGKWISSYSLSEASSASDALNARAKAVLSEDGEYWILNGEKMWLTNAGYADIHITFCKVDGEHFTAFIIDKGSSGVSLGAEEKKTGIKGSSTRPLILQDARVPRENLLGEIGKGHKIAFNILNFGRFKLGAGTVGSCKLALKSAAEYASQRIAFGQPISAFGLIQHKLGEMAIRTYVSESVVYRTAGMIDRNLAGVGLHDAPEALKRIEEYAAECSIVKIFGSEMLDWVVDETVQLFGGAGFVEDFPAERYWRDARVNRIFEGTNEINRLLIPGRLLKAARQGSLPLFDGSYLPGACVGFLAAELRMLSGAKRVATTVLDLAVKRFADGLTEQQEVLAHFADIAIETYAFESALLRVQKKAASSGEGSVAVESAIVRCWAQDALDRIDASARRLLAAVLVGDPLKRQLEAVSRLTARDTQDTIQLRRTAAVAVIVSGGYPFA